VAGAAYTFRAKHHYHLSKVQRITLRWLQIVSKTIASAAGDFDEFCHIECRFRGFFARKTAFLVSQGQIFST